MKVLVVSDSHGEKDNIISVSKIAREAKADKIIHLGDDYDDADFLVEQGTHIERVPGVFSAYYTEKDIDNRKTIELEDWKILLTHTKEKHENDLPDDISPEDLVRDNKVDIVLYGHTHIPAISKQGDVYLINPGHLKTEDKKGFEPSYAILDIDKETIHITIKKLNSGDIVLREIIKR